ncbi:MAG TPA: DUF6352 family protein [Beijerinckiaceae bacterium]|nr:DUF6352 family protein [Beijerinckiaceae bacterium]
MREFWVSSGHQLTRRTEGGGLAVTDELILAYLARPELMPPPDASAAERELHAALLRDPRRTVAPSEIQAIEDADARENWQIMLGFRDRLLAARSIEAAYLDLIRNGIGKTPPLFLNQLVHLILRNALDECEDPYILRAGELFFRPQRVSFHDGAALLADAEIIEWQEHGAAYSPLLTMFGQEPASELDIMSTENAWTYWSRSDAFTMAFNIGSDRQARDALARVIETWVCHLLHIDVRVEPLGAIEDRDWRWFVGLDAEATQIGNALWQGGQVEEDARARVLTTFRLTFADASFVDDRVGTCPVYILVAKTADRLLRMKPQNLITGLPLKAHAHAA